VGGPGVGVEFKLDDLPEMNYTRHTKPYPSGEILIRGPAVFEGYFKNKKLTDETKTADGWLRTGDVGALTELKKLKIIDRAKNIFKLSQGEYIVPEKLERAYEQSTLIGCMFIHGESLRNHIVAIIYPDPEETKKFDLENGGSSMATHAERIKRECVIKKIETDLAVLAKNNNFNSLEKLKSNFVLVAEEFPQEKVLTPTLKLRRKNAREYYQEEIQMIYKRADSMINV
jgi:long-chain acyl-CoA synthetase